MRVALIAWAATLLVGCAGHAPDLQTEKTAALAVSLRLENAIVFQVNGAPVDEPTESPAALSITDAIQLSICRSPELQAAISRVRIAQAEAQQARLWRNPVLSVALRFPESFAGKPMIDAGLTADLISILRKPGSTAVADATLRAVGAQAITTVLDIAAETQERYYEAQAIETSLEVLRQRRGLFDQLLDVADSRLRVGEGTRLDVLALQTQQVELDTQIADRAIELRDQRLALARLIGQPGSTATWTLPAASAIYEAIAPESQCLRLAMHHRPEIQQRIWTLQAMGAQRKLSDWALFDASSGGIQAERDGDWSFGPSADLPIPLFDTGHAAQKRAEAALIEARHELTAVRRRVVEEVRRAHSILVATRMNLERVEKQLIPLQKRRLEQAEAQFKAGQTDLTALLLAEQDFQTSQVQLVDLHRRSAIALVKLERAVGGSGVLNSHTPTTQETTHTESQTTAPR